LAYAENQYKFFKPPNLQKNQYKWGFTRDVLNILPISLKKIKNWVKRVNRA